MEIGTAKAASEWNVDADKPVLHTSPVSVQLLLIKRMSFANPFWVTTHKLRNIGLCCRATLRTSVVPWM